MAAPRKYPDELGERAIRMAVKLRQDPTTEQGAIQRVAEQLGMTPRPCGTGSGSPRSTATPGRAPRPPRPSGSRSSSSRSGSCVGPTTWRIQAVGARNSANFSHGVI
jgi:hypothetical protein